jgi:hypothetical protein
MPQSIPLTAPTSKTTAVVPFGFDDGEVQAASTSPLAGGHDLKDVSLASRRWSAQGGNAQTAVIGNCRRTRRLETIRGRGQMCGGLSCTRRAPRAAVELDAYAPIRRINLWADGRSVGRPPKARSPTFSKNRHGSFRNGRVGNPFEIVLTRSMISFPSLGYTPGNRRQWWNRRLHRKSEQQTCWIFFAPNLSRRHSRARPDEAAERPVDDLRAVQRHHKMTG